MKDKCWLIPAWMLALWLVPWTVWSYTLSDADYDVLKQDILAHPAEFQTYVDANDFGPVAAAYSAGATPDCWVWRTSASEQYLYETTSDLPSTWDWDLFTALPVQAQNAWGRLFASTGQVNPSLDNTRAALPKIWKAPNTAQQPHILALWRRKALRGERLYVIGGNCSTATPSKLVYEGTISPAQVGRALTGAPVQ